MVWSKNPSKTVTWAMFESLNCLLQLKTINKKKIITCLKIALNSFLSNISPEWSKTGLNCKYDKIILFQVFRCYKTSYRIVNVRFLFFLRCYGYGYYHILIKQTLWASVFCQVVVTLFKPYGVKTMKGYKVYERLFWERFSVFRHRAKNFIQHCFQ